MNITYRHTTSRATRARRATTSPADGETGFTLVELLVTMMVMGIIASSVMMVALRTFTTTATITDRRDVFADGRVALDQLSKQLRQAESTDLTDCSGAVSSITFSGYIDGAPATIEWRTTGNSPGPYSLEQSRDAGAASPHFAPVVSSLTNDTPFTCASHGGVIDQVTVSLSLGTTTSTVLIATDVQLRNAQQD
ncbi:MAG TPA: type II secretion system protein [Actinomycetota bacterium]|jgi:prepilin-type N-terminal cleavage/methylation domain-containing protein|nr:type II secretion system protein [Actinomycetota bacterium]